MSKKDLPIQKAFEYLKSKGIVHTQKDISLKLGIATSNLSKAFNGDKEYLTKGFVEKFNNTFGSIFDEKYLLTGEGNMMKNQSNVTFLGPYISENLTQVTYVPIKAYASFIESMYDVEHDLDTYSIIPEEGDDFENEEYTVFDVDGESMYPTIQSGTKILCRKIDENQWEYARGIVVAVYGKTLTVKRILKNDLYVNNILILKADNPTFGEVEVERCEIRGIWQAVRVVSMNLI